MPSLSRGWVRCPEVVSRLSMPTRLLICQTAEGHAGKEGRRIKLWEQAYGTSIPPYRAGPHRNCMFNLRALPTSLEALNVWCGDSHMLILLC